MSSMAFAGGGSSGIPPIVGRLMLDNSHFKSSLKDVEHDADGSTKRTEGRFSKLGSHIGTAVKIGAGVATAAVGGFVVKAISGASDLQESMSKVGVVFGDQAKQVTGFADDMAKRFGLPKREILDAASSIGLVGKASGLSQRDAAGMSTQLSKLAADASSFYNVPLPEALQAIQSGLVGEAEPMRRFGVLLSENAVKEEAYRLGIAQRGAELTEAQKVQSRSSLIMSQMTDASGDLERTQDSLANRMREVRGRFENFAAAVGEKVLPLVLKLFEWGERLAPVISKWFSALKSGFSGEGINAEGFAGVMERIGQVVRDVVEWVRTNWPQIKRTITEVLTAVGDVIRGFIDLVTTIWRNFGDQIMLFVQGTWTTIRGIIEGALQVIQGIVKVITGLIHGDWGRVWEGIKQILGGVWDALVGIVRGGIDRVKAIIWTVLEIIGGIWRGAWDGIKSFFSGIWEGLKSIVRQGIAGVVDFFLAGAELVLRIADRMLGWVPKVGPKISEAAAQFGRFRDEVNIALGGIRDKEVWVGVRLSPYASDEEVRRSAGTAVRTRYATGGPVDQGPYGIDQVWARLTRGEWVMNPEAVKHYGPGFMGAINARKFARGGLVGVDGAAAPTAGLHETMNRHMNIAAVEFAVRVARELRKTGGGTLGGGGWRAITNYLSSRGVPYTITSTYRPGDPGYHGRGKAVDMVGNFLRIFRALEGVAGSLAELFYSGAGYSYKNGRRVPWLVPDHWDHVHAAVFDRGGTLMPGWNAAYNGTGRPEHLVPGGGGGTTVVNMNVTIPITTPTGEVSPEQAKAVRDALIGLGATHSLGFS